VAHEVVSGLGSGKLCHRSRFPRFCSGGSNIHAMVNRRGCWAQHDCPGEARLCNEKEGRLDWEKYSHRPIARPQRRFDQNCGFEHESERVTPPTNAGPVALSRSVRGFRCQLGQRRTKSFSERKAIMRPIRTDQDDAAEFALPPAAKTTPLVDRSAAVLWLQRCLRRSRQPDRFERRR
jgi:hypothetical protein